MFVELYVKCKNTPLTVEFNCLIDDLTFTGG